MNILTEEQSRAIFEKVQNEGKMKDIYNYMINATLPEFKDWDPEEQKKYINAFVSGFKCCLDVSLYTLEHSEKEKRETVCQK